MKNISTGNIDYIDIIDDIDTGGPAAKQKRAGSEKLLKRLRRRAFVLLIFLFTAALSYAWFAAGDSVFLTVEAGALFISARSWTLEEDGSDSPGIKIDGFKKAGGFVILPDTEKSLRNDPGAVFDDYNWAPNIYAAKLIRIANEGTVPLRMKIFFYTYDPDNLGEALWYDLIPLDSDGMPERDFEDDKLMSGMNADISDGYPAYRLDIGEYRQFLLLYGMRFDGDVYQNSAFYADIEIRATQDSNTAENDALSK